MKIGILSNGSDASRGGLLGMLTCHSQAAGDRPRVVPRVLRCRREGAPAPRHRQARRVKGAPRDFDRASGGLNKGRVSFRFFLFYLLLPFSPEMTESCMGGNPEQGRERRSTVSAWIVFRP
jgi:hypothetical protein